MSGPVYIKYNSVSEVGSAGMFARVSEVSSVFNLEFVQKCYVTAYQGPDRGALINIGEVQLGHFPLGLWDEEQFVPAPEI